jgi:inosine-uridine nucleoside N-ribohydrolase
MKKLIGFFVICFFIIGIQLFAQEKQKIIIDCDLGSDIDDAFALALVLASPEFEVLGVVMDHGLTDKRAQIACKMLYETGLDHIPVVVGRQTPNEVGKDKEPGYYTDQFYWAEGFSKVKPVRKSAADFIIDNLRKYPGEIILFTVGPVPNISDVIKKDPEALTFAKHIYSMFGSFYMGYDTGPNPDAEWNVRADIESAKLLVSSGASMTYAGLDITTFVKLEKEMRLKLLMRQSPLTNALCALYSLWGQETPTLYDVVAVGMVLWPELFTTRRAHVRVTDDGFTVIDESQEPNCEVGKTIDKQEFLNRVMRRYLVQNMQRVQ